jgi:hypothetical protein
MSEIILAQMSLSMAECNSWHIEIFLVYVIILCYIKVGNLINEHDFPLLLIVILLHWNLALHLWSKWHLICIWKASIMLPALMLGITIFLFASSKYWAYHISLHTFLTSPPNFMIKELGEWFTQGIMEISPLRRSAVSTWSLCPTFQKLSLSPSPWVDVMNSVMAHCTYTQSCQSSRSGLHREWWVETDGQWYLVHAWNMWGAVGQSFLGMSFLSYVVCFIMFMAGYHVQFRCNPVALLTFR